MDTVSIRQVIAEAKNHEKSTGQLASLLAQRARYLHRAIQLPSNNTVPVLLNFIIHYVEHVPEFLEAIDAIGTDTGLSDYTDPIINVTSEFFIRPPALVNGHSGLNASMAVSYMAHRLVDEVNDRFVKSSGTPLVPMDMTRSSLIIHHLIGEPFANQLDYAVCVIVDGLEQQGYGESTTEYRDGGFNRNNQEWSRELQRWPCLTDTLSINLLLGNETSPLNLH